MMIVVVMMVVVVVVVVARAGVAVSGVTGVAVGELLLKCCTV